MSRKRIAIPLAMLAIPLSLLLALQAQGSEAQEKPTLAVDANPLGSAATSPGNIDPCISVNTGDTFDIDIVVTEVVDLLAFSASLRYDPAIIEVVEKDMDLFLAANEGSNVYDASERLPDDGDGLYEVAAADTADPSAPDSGSGVLARLTLRAKGPGVSPADLPLVDIDDDGEPDKGPFLRDVKGDMISDADQDGFFDGPIAGAIIAVDMPCEDVTPALETPRPGQTPIISPTPAVTEETTEVNPLIIVVAAAGGGLAALAAGALGWLWWRRQRSLP